MFFRKHMNTSIWFVGIFYLELLVCVSERNGDRQVEEVEVRLGLHPFQSVVIDYGERGPRKRATPRTPRESVTANFIVALVAFAAVFVDVGVVVVVVPVIMEDVDGPLSSEKS